MWRYKPDADIGQKKADYEYFLRQQPAKQQKFRVNERSAPA
jgi:hypothetical protein